MGWGGGGGRIERIKFQFKINKSSFRTLVKWKLFNKILSPFNVKILKNTWIKYMDKIHG